MTKKILPLFLIVSLAITSAAPSLCDTRAALRPPAAREHMRAPGASDESPRVDAASSPQEDVPEEARMAHDKKNALIVAGIIAAVPVIAFSTVGAPLSGVAFGVAAGAVTYLIVREVQKTLQSFREHDALRRQAREEKAAAEAAAQRSAPQETEAAAQRPAHTQPDETPQGGEEPARPILPRSEPIEFTAQELGVIEAITQEFSGRDDVIPPLELACAVRERLGDERTAQWGRDRLEVFFLRALDQLGIASEDEREYLGYFVAQLDGAATTPAQAQEYAIDADAEEAPAAADDAQPPLVQATPAALSREEQLLARSVAVIFARQEPLDITRVSHLALDRLGPGRVAQWEQPQAERFFVEVMHALAITDRETMLQYLGTFLRAFNRRKQELQQERADRNERILTRERPSFAHSPLGDGHERVEIPLFDLYVPMIRASQLLSHEEAEALDSLHERLSPALRAGMFPPKEYYDGIMNDLIAGRHELARHKLHRLAVTARIWLEACDIFDERLAGLEPEAGPSETDTLTILVTGGAGFIGSNFVDHITGPGVASAASATYGKDRLRVVVVDDFSSGARENLPGDEEMREKGIVLERVDIRDADAIEAIFTQYAPDIVVNFAAQVSVPRSVEDPQRDHDINVGGIVNLLSASVRHGTRKFIPISSAAVYGDLVPEEVPVREDLPFDPLSPYGRNKALGEVLTRLVEDHYGLTFTALRFANVYGPRQTTHRGEAAVIPAFLERFLQDEAPVIFAAREPQGDNPAGGERDYVYVKDVARAVARAARNGAGTNAVFNIGTGMPTRTRELFDLLQENLGTHVAPSLYGPREGDIASSVYRVENAREGLGWEAAYSLEEALPETILFYLAHLDAAGTPHISTAEIESLRQSI
jgi:UDP-glucose 4-epimerase